MTLGRRDMMSELLRTGEETDVSREFVAVMAGDVEGSPAMCQLVAEERRRLGQRVYQQAFYVIARRIFPPRVAAALWQDIILHRDRLEGQLRRKVGVTVATLDYLHNIANLMPEPTIIAERKLESMTDAAMTDSMTGLYNHAALQAALRQALASRGDEEPLALMMLDVDRFKRFNDEHGHQAGDRVLTQLGRLLSRSVRATDLAARYGGEEFAIVAPHTTPQRAEALAGRIRQLVATQLDVTVSLGGAMAAPDATPSGLLRRADDALYRAKAEGRDRVCFAPPPDPSTPSIDRSER